MNFGVNDSGVQIVTNGLVLWLDAAQKRSYSGSGTTWTDLSGNGNNGTLTNGPTFNSDNGGSIVFDGSNDFVSLSDSGFPSGTNARSAQMWIMRSNTNNASIMSWGTPSFGQMFAMGINSNNFFYSDFGSATFDTTTLSANTWYNIFASYSPTNNRIRLFLNGVEKINVTSDFSDSLVLDTYCYIGARRNGSGTGAAEYFPGRVATCLVYNKALTSDEVTQNYNAEKSRFGL